MMSIRNTHGMVIITDWTISAAFSRWAQLGDSVSLSLILIDLSYLIRTKEHGGFPMLSKQLPTAPRVNVGSITHNT